MLHIFVYKEIDYDNFEKIKEKNKLLSYSSYFNMYCSNFKYSK